MNIRAHETDEESNEKLARARAGEIQAFHELFAEFQGQLKAYLYRLTANRNDTEDLAHDVFIKAFENIKGFRGEASLKTWVFTIATNHARRFLKNGNRWAEDTLVKSRALAHANPEVMRSVDHAALYAPRGTYELKEHIDFCFTCTGKMLPLERQITLILKDVYGFRVREIALIMEITPAQVKHALREARQTMIRIFEHTCAFVNKNGVCDQCSGLNGRFNPREKTQEKLMKIRMTREREKHAGRHHRMYALRAKLVRGIDPLLGQGADLHEVFLDISARVNDPERPREK